MSSYYIGIDVGSHSARCGLFELTESETLKLVKKTESKIQVFNDDENIFEQSSDDIWQSICAITQLMLYETEISPYLIKGIGFDATCSLVALNKDGNPLSVSKTNLNQRNIIMWMDLRAKDETRFINNLPLAVLKTVGGKMSVEMQPPKIMWLKKNFPNFMSDVGFLFDLTDFLVYRATNSTIRSLCSVTCKWTFDAENNCWDENFWKVCNLQELCDNNFIIIGNNFLHPGDTVLQGLSEKAALELGLMPKINVPSALIDAYAGLLGAVKNRKQLITIAGTSACHMIITPKPVYIKGIWGPYKNVLIKDYYVLEAGQTTVGNLLDKILAFSEIGLSHSDVAATLLKAIGHINAEGSDIINLPAEQWFKMNILSKDIHLNPDFAGNRNPRCDFDIRGAIIGINIDSSEMYIAKLYLATIQAIMYGFKEILNQLLMNKVEVDSIVLCGGLSRNALYSRILADVSGFPVTLTQDDDLVLLGAARLNLVTKIQLFDQHNSSDTKKIYPCTLLTKYHEEKFLAYKKIVSLQNELKNAISIEN